MAAIRLKIDDMEVTGEQGQTILEIARANGIDIPTLCHDDRVEMFASCGLCVVETEASPKLLRSCSTFASEGMVVKTNTPRIMQNRKAALELLLSDHIGDCRPPCTLACPAETDCQGYVGLIANGAYEEAYELIKNKIPLPGSIGRVCPHPCEDACRRKLVEEPVSIMALKQFAADAQYANDKIYTAEVGALTGKSIAVIGGGPGGLTAAYFLRAKGHEVTVYDAMPLMGGMLRYGIPEYRLPKKVLQDEIDAIEKMGVKLKNNVRVGEDVTLDKLREDYDAVVIAIGAWTSTGIGCPGEELDGVHGGIEFLWNIAGITPGLLRRRVAIVGGGNTAMDACRTAVRSGATVVYNIYRRTRNEMPAEESEIVEAEEEGVIFRNLTNPLEIVGEGGRVKSVRLQIMELGEPDESGRRRPVPVEGAEETVEVDTVIMAIGQKPNTLGFEDVGKTRWDTIIADEHTFRTNIEGVFAVGDATNNGADIAITAIGEAQRAADMIDRYLSGEELAYEEPFLSKSEKTEEDFVDEAKQPRAKMPHRSAADRKKDFLEINYGFAEEDAKREASRCLECGCMDFFECKLMGYAAKYDAKQETYAGKTHHIKQKDDHPYIRRNPEKCILCGLCVRICEEVAGATALGFMERGFDTLVGTAFDFDLKDTDCISCGQCVHACPTGALSETLMMQKQVPLAEETTDTVCAFCSVGCGMRLATNGNTVLRSLPAVEKNALLCMKGRFGIGETINDERFTVPLVRGNTGMEEASFERAVAHANDALLSLRPKYGEDSVAVAVSDRCTNEEAFLIKEYAEKALKTKGVFSFSLSESGLAGVMGRDVSTAVLEDLPQADLIVAVAPSLDMQRSVAAMRIRQAVRKGSKLLLLSAEGAKDGLLGDIAELCVDMGGELSVLKRILKTMLDSGLGAGMDGLGELKASLEEAAAGEPEKAAAELIIKAKKAVLIFERAVVSVSAARLIADMAAITAGSSARVIQLHSGANAQGLISLGVDSAEAYLEKIEKGEIRGLFIFGEDTGALDLRNIEFLAVQELHMTEAARQADVVLPASCFAETCGSFTAYDNRPGDICAAVKSPVALDNLGQIKALSAHAGAPMPYQSIEDIRSAMGGSGADGACAVRLAPAGDDNLLFSDRPVTDVLQMTLARAAAEKGIFN